MTAPPLVGCVVWSHGFLLVSLVTTWVSLEEVCLPSFEVLNCWLNLVASCLDDENELSMKVIASFSATRFALSFGPWFQQSLHFCQCVHADAVLDVLIQSWQFM